MLIFDGPEHQPESSRVRSVEDSRRERRRIHPDFVDHVAADLY
jgi:hypothetical protein